MVFTLDLRGFPRKSSRAIYSLILCCLIIPSVLLEVCSIRLDYSDNFEVFALPNIIVNLSSVGAHTTTPKPNINHSILC